MARVRRRPRGRRCPAVCQWALGAFLREGDMKLGNRIRLFARDERGVTALEYGILAAIVAVVIGGTVYGSLTSAFTQVFSKITSAVTAAGSSSGS